MEISSLSGNGQPIELKKADQKDQNLRQASKQLEGVFISFVLKAMQKTMPDGALSESKNNLASMMFSSLMGKEIAENGGMGMAENIYQSLKENEGQELPDLNETLNTNAYQNYNMLRLENE